MESKTRYQIYLFVKIPECKLADLFQMKIRTFYGIISEYWIFLVPKPSSTILNALQSLQDEFWN